MMDKILSVYENVDSARIIVCPCSQFADKGGFNESEHANARRMFGGSK